MHILYILVKDILPSLKCICIYNFSGIIQSVISKSEHFFICVISGKSSRMSIKYLPKREAMVTMLRKITKQTNNQTKNELCEPTICSTTKQVKTSLVYKSCIQSIQKAPLLLSSNMCAGGWRFSFGEKTAYIWILSFKTVAFSLLHPQPLKNAGL